MNANLSANDYDLIICDVDGCLAPESSDAMDVPNLVRIADFNRQAADQGDRPRLTCCTGRPLPFVEAMCRLLQNTSVPAVAENGVWLYHPGDNLYLRDPDISPEHLDIVHEAGRLLAEQYCKHDVSQQPGKSASVTLYHPDPEYLESICPAIEEEFAKRDWPFRVSMTWFYINCDLRYISKASGIRRLVEYTGVDLRRTVGIGDTLSDRPIAEAVDWFACPANARDEVKAWADYVSPYTEAEGVVDILDKLGAK